MKIDSKVGIAQEYEIKEILTPSHISSNNLVRALITTVIGGIIILGGVGAAIEPNGSLGKSLYYIIFSIFFSFITLWPYFLGLWYEEVSQKVIISPKGMRYSNFWDKIECFWKDVLIIEVVTHNEMENHALISSWPEYEFITLKGLFVLKGKDLWDPIILKRIYETIVSHNPNAIILEKEKEEMPPVPGC